MEGGKKVSFWEALGKAEQKQLIMYNSLLFSAQVLQNTQARPKRC